MSEIQPRSERLEEQPVWQEEFFYFGNANWPSDATYRVSGERVQYRVEKSIELARLDNGQFGGGSEELSAFLSTYEDVSFIVADSHEIQGTQGGRTEPKVWVTGWKELVNDEEKVQYLEDKAIGAKP